MDGLVFFVIRTATPINTIKLVGRCSVIYKCNIMYKIIKIYVPIIVWFAINAMALSKSNDQCLYS